MSYNGLPKLSLKSLGKGCVKITQRHFKNILKFLEVFWRSSKCIVIFEALINDLSWPPSINDLSWPPSRAHWGLYSIYGKGTLVKDGPWAMQRALQQWDTRAMGMPSWCDLRASRCGWIPWIPSLRHLKLLHRFANHPLEKTRAPTLTLLAHPLKGIFLKGIPCKASFKRCVPWRILSKASL